MVPCAGRKQAVCPQEEQEEEQFLSQDSGFAAHLPVRHPLVHLRASLHHPRSQLRDWNAAPREREAGRAPFPPATSISPKILVFSISGPMLSIE